jgi:hypothetical protein
LEPPPPFLEAPKVGTVILTPPAPGRSSLPFV